MAILNYSTSISARRTASEIQNTLAGAGAEHVSIKYDDGKPVQLTFVIETDHGERAFQLPADSEGVYFALVNDAHVPKSKRTHEQAERVAWRILKEWVAAQLAIIEARMAKLDQVMLPYMLVGNGNPLYVQYQVSAGLRQSIESGSS